MAFPNLLNQQEVIQLANRVAPDISITSKSNEQEGQFGDKKDLFKKDQFHHQQNPGFSQPNNWSGENQVVAMQQTPYYYPYYPPCKCCPYNSHWHR